MNDSFFHTVISKFTVVELNSIICHDGSRYPKLKYYIALYESNHISLGHCHVSLGFHLLDEVISGQDDELLTPYYIGQWPYNVHPPASEWPRSHDRVKHLNRLSGKRCMPLTFVTFS